MNEQFENHAESPTASNLALISACGLYCGACGIFQATQEKDTEKTLHYAVVLNQTFDETLCDGCGAERKSLHCSKMCSFIDCKQRRGVNLCPDCKEFPCSELIEFQSKMPHRIEILQSQLRLKEIGWEKWLFEMNDLFSCPQCKAANSAYQLDCRMCGYIPGSRFVSKHKDSIEKYMLK